MSRQHLSSSASSASTPPVLQLAALSSALLPPAQAEAAPGTPFTPPTAFRLLPLGRFRAADGSGRPAGVPEGWLLTAARAQQLADALAARGSAMVVDYEHQTEEAAKNGQPAPAAGWCERLEVRADGLYAVEVLWTPRAAAMLAAREYRYVSPVFSYDTESGEVLALASVALTNRPGLDGLTDLARLRALVSLGALAASNDVSTAVPPLFQPQENAPMKALLAALGLAEAATENEALAALAALKSGHTTELASLRAQPATPDPARFVEIATLSAVQGELATARAELASLRAGQQQAEVEAAVQAGLEAGKLMPATEAWARSLGQSNLAALKSFIEAAPVIAKPGQTQTNGQAPAGAAGSINNSAADVAVMKALGLSAEQFAAGKKE